MFVKPTSVEVRVPDPTRMRTPDYFLPAEGREVTPSRYWTRRIMDGDVVEASTPVAAPGPILPAPSAASDSQA